MKNLQLTRRFLLTALIGTALFANMPAVAETQAVSPANMVVTSGQITYGSIKVDGLNVAYREAGNPANPKLVLLHGFPAGSHQYRDLIRSLSDKFHVISATNALGMGIE